MHVCLYHVRAVPKEAREGGGYSGIGVTEYCELRWRCQESNSDPLEEHEVLLTAGPSLQPLFLVSFVWAILGQNNNNTLMICSRFLDMG